MNDLDVASYTESSMSVLNYPMEMQSGDVVIDIGAHVGFLGLPMAHRGIKVYAYEPSPSNFSLLNQNKQQNRLDSLQVFPFAVSTAKGEEFFMVGQSSTTGSLQRAGFSFAKSAATQVVVQTTTLADILTENKIGEVKLLKMDCEGSEYDILMQDNVKDCLKKCAFLIIEVHPVKMQYDKYQLYMHLANLGFKITVAESPGNGCADFYCRNLNA